MHRTGIGQDSHAFCPKEEKKPLVIGGVVLSDTGGFLADSDGDIIFHALCNAITSLTGVPVLGKIAVELCKKGEKNSKIYLEKAVATLQKQKIVHVAISLEGLRPKLESALSSIRKSVADALHISIEQVGITVTSGDYLTDFGKGHGMQCLCVMTTWEKSL